MNRVRHTRGGLSRVTWLGALLLGLWGWLGGAPAALAVETVTYYHLDALGSPVAASDAQGALLWREAYRPYGQRLRDEHGGAERLGYTAKPEEAAFGLSYFGARWYDPALGRFLGIDPVAFQEDNLHSFNRYAYANNNPYRYVDPDGRAAVCGWGDGTGCGGSSLGGGGGLTPFDGYLMMPTMGANQLGAPSIGRSVSRTAEATSSVTSIQTFRNLRPSDPIGTPSTQTIANIQRTSQSGKFNYIVTQDGRLILGRSGPSRPNSHISLAQGQDVLAAGEAKFVKGKLIYIDNKSGHYQPSGESAKQAALGAFEQHQVRPRDGYIERKL